MLDSLRTIWYDGEKEGITVGREYVPKVRITVDLTIAQFEGLKTVAQHMGVSNPTALRRAVEGFCRSYTAQIEDPAGSEGVAQ
jgi:hypothetical protein